MVVPMRGVASGRGSPDVCANHAGELRRYSDRIAAAESESLLRRPSRTAISSSRSLRRRAEASPRGTSCVARRAAPGAKAPAESTGRAADLPIGAPMLVMRLPNGRPLTILAPVTSSVVCERFGHRSATTCQAGPAQARRAARPSEMCAAPGANTIATVKGAARRADSDILRLA